MRHLILSALFIMAVAQATSVTLSPINDGLGTIGPAADFQVYTGSFNLNTTTGQTSIKLVFNYGGCGLTEFRDAGVNLNVGDLLLEAGDDLYGVAIANHIGATNNNSDTSMFTSVTAGYVYETTSYLTSNTVLNNSHDEYRENTDVWLGSTATQLSSLAETVRRTAGTNTYTVTLTGILPTSLVNDIARNGVTVEFGSATCANGYMVGHAPATCIPEPMSLGLMGSGLILFGAFGRKKLGRQ